MTGSWAWKWYEVSGKEVRYVGWARLRWRGLEMEYGQGEGVSGD